MASIYPNFPESIKAAATVAEVIPLIRQLKLPSRYARAMLHAWSVVHRRDLRQADYIAVIERKNVTPVYKNT